MSEKEVKEINVSDTSFIWLLSLLIILPFLAGVGVGAFMRFTVTPQSVHFATDKFDCDCDPNLEIDTDAYEIKL
jgi:hypothetical protein